MYSSSINTKHNSFNRIRKRKICTTTFNWNVMEKINVLRYMGVFLVCLLILKPCVGMSFTVWGGPGCNGYQATYGYCGCISLPFNGGYEFIEGGPTVFVYNDNYCEGEIQNTLVSSTKDCSGFGWKSVDIQCP
ncbi:hypothetical protein SUGI_0540740 [Cryptomeria japonica]|nr:hypothetical protein SUGI_0540740 [Cryptomeria japonica]